jgi:hypothetical protein
LGFCFKNTIFSMQNSKNLNLTSFIKFDIFEILNI